MNKKMCFMIMITQVRCKVIGHAVQRKALLCFPEILNDVELALQKKMTSFTAVD